MLAAHSPPFSERRLGGLALTVLLHAILILGWQAARRPQPQAAPDAAPRRIQWIQLPVSIPRMPALPHTAAARKDRTGMAKPADRPRASARAPAPASVTTPAPAPAAATPAAVAPSAAEILRQAKRDIGAIDKALRKENRPYIAAPPDSPQIRLRKGIELANELAPNRLWEAPKVEELVNNTGDGARRTRVVTANGTYCVTERATNTSIDMIEKHGKLRLTNCPAHEEPAKAQDWRTARD